MTAKVVPLITSQEAKLLWVNARDSILHALEHFAELSSENASEFHHKKWIVLSVHHAAETFCNMVLKQFDPENPKFKRNGEDWYPSLITAINELLQPNNPARLTRAEVQLLGLLKELNHSRNSIMHGKVPEKLDLSLGVMSILGLSRVVHRRQGESVEDILDQDPPIQRDIVEALRYTEIQDYYRFVEAFLAEEFSDQYLPACENCGINSIVDLRCEACFETMESFTCDSCDEELLLPESWRFRCGSEVTCPSCGNKISA
jgi:hypothetical protein